MSEREREMRHLAQRLEGLYNHTWGTVTVTRHNVGVILLSDGTVRIVGSAPLSYRAALDVADAITTLAIGGAKIKTHEAVESAESGVAPV